MNGLYLLKLRFHYSKKIRKIFESDIHGAYTLYYLTTICIFQDRNYRAQFMKLSLSRSNFNVKSKEINEKVNFTPI